MSIRDKVAVIGTGCTRFGELFHMSPEDMMVEAAYEAYEDAGIDPKDIKACWFSTTRTGTAGVAAGDPLKLYGVPITRVENFCASGMDAFRNAVFSVAAGMYDIVLVIGLEKLKDSGGRGLGANARHPVLARGSTAPSLFALAATRYFAKFGIDKSTLAKVAVKNHWFGARNDKAHLKMEIEEDKVLNAPMIASPLGLFDCCPTTDGAAAAIICSTDIAKKFRDDYATVRGLGLAVTSGMPYFKPNFDYLGFPATTMAAEQAYEMAGISDPVKEIDFAEVHDCFTITEILNYEDLKLCKKGEGGKFIEEGRSAHGGDFPVNVSGGLKTFGHPIGATGVRMIYEVTRQLQGKCGERQVPNATTGMAHNLGGPGAVGAVAILSRN